MLIRMADSTVLTAFLAQAASPTGLLGSPLLLMVVVMGIFYALLILPQQKQQKRVRQMRAALKNGDKVITTGGFTARLSAWKMMPCRFASPTR